MKFVIVIVFLSLHAVANADGVRFVTDDGKGAFAQSIYVSAGPLRKPAGTTEADQKLAAYLNTQLGAKKRFRQTSRVKPRIVAQEP